MSVTNHVLAFSSVEAIDPVNQRSRCSITGSVSADESSRPAMNGTSDKTFTYSAWCVDGITPADVASAFQIEDATAIGFWDALIVAVAARAGARRLLSEDLTAGQVISGVTVHNPFVE